MNFKDEETLRVLAKTLLKHDFGLEVEIPQMKLIPAMPLRLNYILWIEDLLNYSGLTDMTSVHGIDVGKHNIFLILLLKTIVFLLPLMSNYKIICRHLRSQLNYFHAICI